MQVQIQTSLLQNPEFLPSVLATMVDGVIIINEKGTIQSMNPAAESMFGYSISEVAGNNIKKLMPQSYAHHHDTFLRNFLDTRDAKIIGIGREVEALRKDGSIFPMELSVSEVKIGAAIYFTGIIRDITERKEAQEKLQSLLSDLEDRVDLRTRELKDELLERHKLEEIGRERQAELAQILRVNTMWEMGTTLAHEINQPLTAIFTYAQGLQKQLESDGESAQKNTVDKMIIHLEHSINVVEKFRQFVKKRKPDFEVLEINKLIREAIALVEFESRESSIRITTQLDCRAMVSGDNVQMQQVIINLLRNSIESLHGRPKNDRHISIRSMNTIDTIEVCVQDSGEGFKKSNQSKIFDPFYSTKKYGLGMGLAISKSILESHSGNIWIDQNYSAGVSIHFSLPADRTSTHESHLAQVSVS